MHTLFTNFIKRTLILATFGIATVSFAMESDEIFLGQIVESSDIEAPQTNQFLNTTKNMVFDSFAKITNMYSTWRYGKSSDTIEKSPENSLVSTSQTGKKEIKLFESKDIANESVKVIWLSKRNALKFGFGAVGLVIIGYTTYVLYENGTIKKVTDVMKKHPYITAGSVTGTIAIIGSILLYKYYKNKPKVPTA